MCHINSNPKKKKADIVMRRLRKGGPSFEKAVDITGEGSGSRVDPRAVKALLHARDELRRMLNPHMEPS